MDNKMVKVIAATVAVVIVIFLLISFFNMPDRRSGTERVGDAIRNLPEGADKAVDQLGDRTPAQRTGDTIRGIGK